MKTYNWEGVNPDGYFLDKLEPIPSALPSFQKLFQVSADRKSGSAGMPRPISYAVFCLKKKNLGVARELAAGLERPMKRDVMPAFTRTADPPGADLVTVAISA